ncbi:conserved hypothetical protein [Talaromyces stipitatus ATCC 10500]|uniref:N-acetyltransferase domain-containing protein n=1 Tax=Talaromyces stipitatus (strain ATCC 10500 / CBS 375.48 / QM 6759 / NRRL 1006) TaxID=441959 RepID=B8M0F3_TALSN|nr:uncharacterized protein TSTA_084810 [Talaromyces stipitatus ATCC 10500]EED21250.1 conserved hypothetical protein [Talaromyces stipitatus ATCC 10500]
MAITISPTSPDDIRPIVCLAESAFPVLYSTLFDGPLKESTIDALGEQRIKSQFRENEKSEGKGKPANRFFAFKAIDDSTGRIVGEARWMIFYEDEVLTKSIEEEVQDRLSLGVPQMQVQATAVFARLLNTARREVLAVPSSETGSDAPVKLRKRVYLIALAVHPDYQRKGIGRRLVQWGLDEADRLGRISYLEATMEGIRLYEQSGFEKVKDISMDLTPFGGKGKLPFRLMIRQPRSKP